MLDADVVVCGGGPAGLAAAIACRMRGLSVVLADCAAPAIDKACGEGLLPEAVAALQQLGVHLQNLPGTPLLGITFIQGESAAAQSRFRNGPGWGIKRTDLHEALRRRAEQIGIRLYWNIYITGLGQSADQVEVCTRSGTLRAKWCIGADGSMSKVRRWAGLDDGHTHNMRIGLRRHYAIPSASNMTEVYWSSAGQAYLTPVGLKELGLALIRRSRAETFDVALDDYPELKKRLKGVPTTGTTLGGITCNRQLRRVTAGRLALVGDASGSVDAITGAGLTLAFQQALALSHAIRSDNLKTYQKTHHDLRKSAATLSSLLLALDRFPALRRVAFASFSRRPDLFEAMLALHSGATPFTYWGSQGALTLGLQTLIG